MSRSSDPSGEPRRAQEHHFTTHDGVELFYRRWPARAPRRGAVVMFHRGHEHSGRMAHLVDELNLPEFDFYAWDARGHGRSPGVRGFAPSISHSIRDVQTFIQHIQQTDGMAQEDIAVLAQSLSAVIAAAWVHDYAPRLRCLLLASPAFSVRLYVPLARPGLKLLHALRGSFFVHSYVRSTLLTRDPARQKSFDSDPLITRAISVNILLELYDLASRVVDDAQAIVVPTQLLISGKDWVVRLPPQHRFFDRLGAAVKEKHVLDGFLHDTLGELERDKAISLARDFLSRMFSTPPPRVDLSDADRQGYTAAEAVALARPLAMLSPRGIYWAIGRLGIRIGGWMSLGIRLGRETGFDSGSSLDYVYRNRPQGRGPIGRFVDRQYLSAIGWRGIRRRKLHLEELLRLGAQRLRASGQPVRLLDIAAGGARYVLDAFADGEDRPEAILLWDCDEKSVRRGRERIAERGFEDIARFESGDALDRDSLVSLEPKHTLVVASGLYELYSDNTRVSRSLAGVAAAMEPGGYFVYTCQPWHPQLEVIARTLTRQRDGAPWVMRRRSQAEMDQLVGDAGFEKVDQRIDPWGIFTVSLARRLVA